MHLRILIPAIQLAEIHEETLKDADNLGFTLELCHKVKIIIWNKQSFLSIFLGGFIKNELFCAEKLQEPE